MAWIYLIVAGLFEIVWAVSMKYSQGLTKLWPSVITVAAGIVSIILLTQAVKTLPIGSSYAIWTGIGAVGSAILGIVLFGESATGIRIACIVLIVSGVVGLKLAMNH